MTTEQKNTIDNMSHYELQERWRNAPIGYPLLQGDTGNYYTSVLKSKGGFNPKDSKAIGWDNS